MHIAKIYKRYNTIPSLQLHMYRVAAVAQLIANHSKEKVDTHAVISACLLHDMGNILKFNFELFPEFFKPEGIEYWKKIRTQFAEKYGEDEHYATFEIAKEIGVSEKTMKLLHAIGFSNAVINKNHHDFAQKICAYADCRVEPMGVVSLQRRLEDGRKRFQLNKKLSENSTFFQEMSVALYEIEKQIFELNDLKPEDITEECIQSSLKKLKHFEVN